MRDPFVATEPFGENSACAMPERVPGCEHHRRPAAAIQNDIRIERYWPSAAPAADIGERKMTFAAKHDFCRSKRLAACIG